VTKLAGIQENKSKAAYLSRLPSLDGWRAISITLVLGSHSTHTAHFPHQLDIVFKWAFDSDLGVRSFFLISGFLITWLMLLENDRSGRINLKHFYVRRCLRILPVYLVYLGAIAGLQAFTPYSQSTIHWIANLTFTTNFLGAGAATGHLWSLAVEEQFYLTWPLAVVLFGLAATPRRVLFAFGLVLAVSPFWRVISYTHTYTHPLFGGYSLLNYMDSLVIGCASAIFLNRKPTLLEKYLTADPWLPALSAMALILTPYILNKLFLLGVFTVSLGPSCEALGLAVLLLQSLFLANWGFYRILNWRWVRQIGVLSYSIYIWQQIFWMQPETLGVGDVWWMSFPGWLLPVFFVAFISYYGLERPLLGLRSRFR